MIFRLKKHYCCLEIDEFWTYVGSKSNKQWLIYAYERESRDIIAYVLGDRSAKTANKLRKKLKKLGIPYDRVATDNWKTFITAFKKNITNAKHDIGKQYTNGIEGNNCLLRHRFYDDCLEKHVVFLKLISIILRRLK